MQVSETSLQQSVAKRVTVRTGGAGHAHSGVIKAPSRPKTNGATADTHLKREQIKVVSLGG
jgi:hypothetical protein